MGAGDAVGGGEIGDGARDPQGAGIAAGRKAHPVGRVGQPEDIGALAVYLLSSLSGFSTGQDFIVDGGMTRKMIYAE